MPAPFDTDWLARAADGLDAAGRTRLIQAARVAQPLLQGLHASTREPLATHAAEVACILAQMNADAATRASALLAPVAAEETFPTAGKDPLAKEFGSEIASLVQGARKLLGMSRMARLNTDDPRMGVDQKELQRKMLLAMAADLRIVLLRLASRLQTLRWHASSKTACPFNLAQETMDLYAPLANRLGIWQLKWEIEDLAFRFLQPDTYKMIARELEEKRVEREQFIERVVNQLREALQNEGVQADVSGRPKHIYSIWNKMRNKQLSFGQLYDLRALRVIVNDERDCYAALAVVHAMWSPISEEFDDYISRPKPNGYRSLHTVVADTDGKPFEVQIRTHEMHEFAEYGMAAHWRYKEAGPKGGTQVAASEYDRKVAWMRQLLSWSKADDVTLQGQASTRGLAAGVSALDPDERIYVLTPQARVIELPAGATPVDFAYALHTDLGHRCRGAKVDGQMVPLLTHLHTGQTVEIIAAKSGGPSRDWLNPQLGYLASNRSRAKVRAWFNAIELQERIAQGHSLVDRELQRLGKTAVNQEQLANQLGFARADDLYVAVAKDEFSLRHIDQYFRHVRDANASEPASPDQLQLEGATDNVTRSGKSGVLVVGVDSLMTQLARCCRPAPPDRIRGFVTRGRGVSIHRSDCHSFAALAARHPERIIDVSWGDTQDRVYPVSISIHAPDRLNLLRDITDVFGRLRLNVIGVNTQSRRSLAHMIFTVEVKNGEQITRALAALNEIPGFSATRL
ncbi:MAG: bifunctional (p)ppGpp synthetase/guanosine-3',5'-bis(diphosphate) 3'-pyrophosphohydrolase [Pusillimonas sp.]|nr:bifunctional (p)ppGpp synthetase/guanosine-3',5'-bis(diphosphate) 3'-pyrophosphohydrolase [Pusillimonas sp.]